VEVRAVISLFDDERNQLLDELRQYHDGRYFRSSESSWQILQFLLHKEYPIVVRLAIHLPDQQPQRLLLFDSF
jgi:hypothetical protein